MKLKIYFLSILCLLISCSRTGDNRISENNAKLINLNPRSKHSSIADAIQITKVINLESNDSSIISNGQFIKRIITNKGRFYIMDWKYMSVKVFDDTGKYLHSIGSLGTGRGQFINLQDIQISPLHNSLWALCNTPRKIIEFTLDGKVRREMQIPFFASDFGFETLNQIYFFVNQNKTASSEDKNILVTDSNLTVQERLFDLPQKVKTGISFTGGIYPIGDEIYYNPPLSRNIYLLRNDSAKAVYKIDFANGNVPNDFNIADSLDYYLSNRNFLTRSFIKKDNYIGFNYLTKGTPSIFLFNTKNKQLFISDSKLNPLDELFNNSIYESEVQLIMLCTYKGSSDFLKKNASLIKQKYPLLFQHIVQKKIHDNPSLIFFTLK